MIFGFFIEERENVASTGMRHNPRLLQYPNRISISAVSWAWLLPQEASRVEDSTFMENTMLAHRR
jgi:hypothetical protein